MTFFITGATGHLGYHLVRHLRAHHHHVYALVLPDDPLTSSLPKNVMVVEGNLLDPSSLDRFLNHPHDGYRVIIHAASRVTTQSKKDLLTYKVNVEGAQNMIDLTKRHHIDHLIYVSSVHALKTLSHRQLVNETHMGDPSSIRGFYAKTKAEATQKMWTEHQLNNLPVSIVFPSGFIGPQDLGKGYTTLMIKEAMAKRMNIFFRGGYDFVDVRDVAEAIVKIAEMKFIGEKFILNGDYVSFNQIMRWVDEAMQHRPCRVCMPRFFIWLAIPLLTMYYRITGKKPLLTGYAFETMQTPVRFDHSHASKTFGYEPRSIQVTVFDTVKDLGSRPK
jgi:dihydroflavonol-4-reductase